MFANRNSRCCHSPSTRCLLRSRIILGPLSRARCFGGEFSSRRRTVALARVVLSSNASDPRRKKLVSILSRFRKSAEAVGPSETTVALARNLRDEVVGYYQAGNLEDALNTARQLLELQRRELGESHPDFSVGLKNVAALERLRGAEIDARQSRQSLPTQSPHSSAFPAVVDMAPVISASRVDPINDPESALLDRVLRLDYQGTGDQTCLVDVQQWARGARQAVAGGHRPLPSLIEGFASLIKLVEHYSSLGNEEWITVHDTIVRHFGRPLAKAAASGRIVIGDPLTRSGSNSFIPNSGGFDQDRIE